MKRLTTNNKDSGTPSIRLNNTSKHANYTYWHLIPFYLTLTPTKIHFDHKHPPIYIYIYIYISFYLFIARVVWCFLHFCPQCNSTTFSILPWFFMRARIDWLFCLPTISGVYVCVWGGVFRVVVSGLSDTTQQLHESTCLWTLRNFYFPYFTVM